MKELRFVIEREYPAEIDVSVMDFPDGKDAAPRKRFGFTVNCGEFDVKRLIRNGMDLDGAMDYYVKWIDDTVRALLLSEWTAESGLAELTDLVKEKIKAFF